MSIIVDGTPQGMPCFKGSKEIETMTTATIENAVNARGRRINIITCGPVTAKITELSHGGRARLVVSIDGTIALRTVCAGLVVANMTVASYLKSRTDLGL